MTPRVCVTTTGNEVPLARYTRAASCSSRSGHCAPLAAGDGFNLPLSETAHLGVTQRLRRTAEAWLPLFLSEGTGRTTSAERGPQEKRPVGARSDAI